MKISLEDREYLRKKFKRMRTGQYIYASTLIRGTSISEKETFRIIMYLLKNRIVEKRFQIRIDGNFFRDSYEKFSEIPLVVYDDESGKDVTVNFKENVFVFYEVIL